MAAEAILVSGVTEIFKRLVTDGVKEIGMAMGVRKDLEKLQSTLNMILSVITDAERKQLKDASVKLWMKDLKALAYEAEDILDEYSYYKILRRRPHNKVRNFFSFSPNMNHKIKDINEKLNVISSRRTTLGLEYSIGSSSSETMMNRETYSYADASSVFGRDNDKLKIIDMLRMDDSVETVSVIPIVGRGGLGKTTLAQLVYNDHYFSNKKNFDIKMWVCVTQTFDVKRILINITESITGSKCEEEEEEDISNFDVVLNRLHGHLRGKKFLLVLDDVWNENQEEWFKLKNPLFTVSAVGSKIIVTTRSLKVASIVVEGKFPPYQLQPLNKSECWSIFTQRAFGASGGAGIPPNLVAIGKELLNRCDGLPLAANFLGSLLRNKEEKEWLIIKNSEIWDEQQVEKDDGNRILPVLKLSYHLLPSHLKQCFSYCSIFPKKSEIKRETLVQLWIAEGFLSQLNETNEMSIQEIGNRKFQILLNNSFFQDVHDYGETLTCTIHDLVHDLAQSVTGNEECLILTERSDHNMQHISKAHRLRLVNLDEKMLADASARLNDAKELRSLFVNRIGKSMNIHSVIDNNKRLRVLDLSGTDLEDLPSSIGNLIHLRYLDLSYTNIKMLPKSISKLYNLQTLKLFATKILMFPEGMETLSNLKHLEYSERKA